MKEDGSRRKRKRESTPCGPEGLSIPLTVGKRGVEGMEEKWIYGSGI